MYIYNYISLYVILYHYIYILTIRVMIIPIIMTIIVIIINNMIRTEPDVCPEPVFSRNGPVFFHGPPRSLRRGQNRG